MYIGEGVKKTKMKKILLCSFLIGLLMAFQTPAHAAKLSLNPASANLTEECENIVNIMVDTQGEDTRGADAFMSYNPNEIEMLSILPGDMYNSYPGKIIRNGDIFITAFSENGFFVGSGTLARLVFKSKPGVKSTTISFKYSPGSTVDSNVAGREANDILNTVFSGTYTFEPGVCEGKILLPATPPSPLSDTKPPWTENLRPGIDWGNMVPNSDLSFTILDNLSGVDLNSLKIEIDNILYTKDGENIFNYEGTPRKYKIIINPENDFIKNEGEKIPVSIKARDLDNNLLSLDYTFTAYPISECPESLRPAAPTIKYSTGARNMILILLILIIVLFTTNVWLVTEPPIEDTEPVEGREKATAKPKRKKRLKT